MAQIAIAALEKANVSVSAATTEQAAEASQSEPRPTNETHEQEAKASPAERPVSTDLAAEALAVHSLAIATHELGLGGSPALTNADQLKTRPWVRTLPQRRRIPGVVLTIGSLAVICGGALLLIQKRTMSTVAPLQGRLTVQSRPVGAEVIVDGQTRGATPLTVSLSAGAHAMTLRLNEQERTVPVQALAGAEIRHYFDFTPSTESVSEQSSRISVITDPPKAQVNVDGQARGASPLTIEDLSPGEHRITVKGDTGSADRTVTIAAGSTTSLIFSLPKESTPPTSLAGWLAVSAPFETEILENNELLGTSGTSKIMLPSGRHQLNLVNQSLEYRETRTAEVVPGKTTTVRVDPPKAKLSANARPWADVLVDGKVVGQTPMANVEVSIGRHDIVFRHPQLGERRQTVVVTPKGPNRVNVDLTK